MNGRPGYALIMLLLVVSVLSIGLMAALPVWRTQIQREKEEELIFRGRQIVEAVRLFQAKNPGRYPRSLQELYEKRFLRRLYKDPMTPSGEWNCLLLSGSPGQGTGGALQQVLLVPQSVLSSLSDPKLIGVASSSKRPSFKIYNQAQSYDQWLFYYGQDPRSRPEVIRLGKTGPSS
jgi:type II secretory pathway pseudopilin PulG